MREYKYKTKRLDGQWVEGYYYAKPILNQHYILESENQWMIDLDTLCEFTGLYDKNKNMIYEHDIVQDCYDNKQEIKYEICNCGCCYDVYGWNMPYDTEEDMEVIGNIFDNPELLELN